MKEAQPSWYTAVPTMHQAILSRAGAQPGDHRCRALALPALVFRLAPAQVMLALAETFRAPVIEAYGMTEAAHQMTSNPLPPTRPEAWLGRRGGRPPRAGRA